MRIRELVKPTIGARADEFCGLVLDRMRVFGTRHVIVTGEKGIHGVAAEAEVERADPQTPVGTLARQVPIVESDAPVEEAANLMRSGKVSCLPVVDGSTLAGIITVDSLLELIATRK